MDGRESVLEGQAERVLAEIARLEAELDSGPLLVRGFQGPADAEQAAG